MAGSVVRSGQPKSDRDGLDMRMLDVGRIKERERRAGGLASASVGAGAVLCCAVLLPASWLA